MTRNIREDVALLDFIQQDDISIEKDHVRNYANNLIARTLKRCFLTPYIALEQISRVLAYFHIFLPKYTFMEGSKGFVEFPVYQFGEVMGLNNDGEVVTKTTTPFHLTFTYSTNEKGMYDIVASITKDPSLKESKLAEPETGPKTTPGSTVTGQPIDMKHDHDMNGKEDDKSVDSIEKKLMKPGPQFSGPETGPKPTPGAQLLTGSRKVMLGGKLPLF